MLFLAQFRPKNEDLGQNIGWKNSGWCQICYNYVLLLLKLNYTMSWWLLSFKLSILIVICNSRPTSGLKKGDLGPKMALCYWKLNSSMLVLVVVTDSLSIFSNQRWSWIQNFLIFSFLSFAQFWVILGITHFTPKFSFSKKILEHGLIKH